MTRAEKLLVVGPAWVGDMVIACSLVATLRERRPGAEVHVLAPAATAPIAGRMPDVARVHVLAVGHGQLALSRRRETGRTLRCEGFAQAFVLPNTWKSALAPLFAGVPRRTGWHGEARFGLLNDRRRLDPERLPRLVDRYVALALPAGAPPPEPPWPRLVSDAARGAALCAELGLDPRRDVLALCPGAEFGPSKRWPAAHFARVAEHHLRSRGDVWLFGSPRDVDHAAAVRAAVDAGLRDRVFDLAGRTTLHDVIDLLAMVTGVVSNDSGLMHVAAALDRPLVAVFGSTSPDYTPPLAPMAHVVREALPCSPCFARECRYGHLNCLVGLDPRRVIEVLDSP